MNLKACIKLSPSYPGTYELIKLFYITLWLETVACAKEYWQLFLDIPGNSSSPSSFTYSGDTLTHVRVSREYPWAEFVRASRARSQLRVQRQPSRFDIWVAMCFTRVSRFMLQYPGRIPMVTRAIYDWFSGKYSTKKLRERRRLRWSISNCSVIIKVRRKPVISGRWES